MGSYEKYNGGGGGSTGITPPNPDPDDPVDPPINNYPSNSLGIAFPLDLDASYVITSPYGMREDPISG